VSHLEARLLAVQVALITGRSENSRKYTEDNLKAEGFGEECLQDGQGKVHRTEEVCYVALHLRNMEGDQHTLASVYKPERRKQLQDAGYKLVATFGDQFRCSPLALAVRACSLPPACLRLTLQCMCSDLEGANSAIASWKIPNPVYLIL
jgi:HAD superfamily, subfamily IIIB (Acid phosphatase)